MVTFSTKSQGIWSSKPIGCNVNLVRDLITSGHGGWNVQLINDIFLPSEAQQIIQIPLPLNWQQDGFTWGANKKNFYILVPKISTKISMWHKLIECVSKIILHFSVHRN